MMYKQKHFYYILFPLCICFLLMGNNSFAQIDKSKIKKKSKQSKEESAKANLDKKPMARLSSEDQQRVEKMLYEGMLAIIKNNGKVAEETFLNCLKIDPKNDAAFYQLAKMHFGSKNQEKALEYARKASEAAPSNKWYQLLYAEVLMEDVRYEEAAKVYQNLTKTYPNNHEYYIDLASIYAQAGKFEQALKVYEDLEQKVGIVEQFFFPKLRLYDRLGRMDDAVEDVQKLVDKNPTDIRYRFMAAELLMSLQRNEEAMVHYEKILEIDPENTEAKLKVADTLRKEGNDEEYLAEMKKMLANSEAGLDRKIEILKQYAQSIDLKNPAENQHIIQLTEGVVKQYNDNATAHTFYGNLLFNCNKKREALQAFKQTVEIDPDQLDIWKNILWVEYELDDYDLLLKDSKEMISLFPNQPIPYYFSGLSYYQNKNYEKAVKTLKRGGMISVGDKELAGEIYGLLGETYHSMEEFEKSDKSYEKALELNPSNPTLLNNFSYYLSLRGDKLDKAAEMSAKSIELSPNNSSFFDTYGWILFKQKKYGDAKTWIEKSLNNNGNNNPTILEHYGDTLFKLNDIDGAVQYWNKAKEKGGDATRLDQKISSRRLID